MRSRIAILGLGLLLGVTWDSPSRLSAASIVAVPPPVPESLSPEGWLKRAREAQARGLHKQAIDLAGRAIGAAPKDPRGYFLRSQSYETTRQFGLAEADLGSAMDLAPVEPALLMQRGTLRLKMGEFAASLADFDRYVELRPTRAPELWQRGIALFYAGRYADGRKQFELHRTVNPDDVENSAWHYACIARLDGVEAARAAWLEVRGDTRVPMSQIQDLFLGRTTPEALLQVAEASPNPAAKLSAEFYAQFYLSLYHGAAGRKEPEALGAGEAAKRAASMGLMGDIARVHEEWVVHRLRAAATAK